jgi:hypothetical protein
LRHISVSRAARIHQGNYFSHHSGRFAGRNTVGEAAATITEKQIHIYLDKEGIEARCASMELCVLMADICKIQKPQHISLLQQTMSDIKLKKLQDIFSKHGIHIAEILIDGKPTMSPRFLHRSWFVSDEVPARKHDRSGDIENYCSPRKRSTDEDQPDLSDDEDLARQLPFNDYTTVERKRLESGELGILVVEKTSIRNISYFGELLVSISLTTCKRIN